MRRILSGINLKCGICKFPFEVITAWYCGACLVGFVVTLTPVKSKHAYCVWSGTPFRDVLIIRSGSEHGMVFNIWELVLAKLTWKSSVCVCVERPFLQTEGDPRSRHEFKRLVNGVRSSKVTQYCMEAFQTRKRAHRGVCLRKWGGADKIGITVEGSLKISSFQRIPSCMAKCC